MVVGTVTNPANLDITACVRTPGITGLPDFRPQPHKTMARG